MEIGALLVGLGVIVTIWAGVVIALALCGQRGNAREFAMFLPNLLFLFRALIADPRVPRRAKVALGIASLWIASPIDLVPEFIPVAGPLDDAIVAVLVLRFVLRSTDRAVLHEHWRGDPRTLERLLAVTRA